ncbi:MAG: DoxX family protein [Halobacteriaceae archaeon]
MAVEGTAGTFLLLGRILFGATLGFMALNHFMNADMMTGYAESKGIPAPGLAVVASGVTLLLGALAILVGAYPTLGAGAVATFLLITTPTMHNFWALEGEEQMNEMQQFLKNVALLGGALAFLAVSGQEWSFAVGVGLF